MGGFRVAIVGATGLVGQEFIKIIEQQEFPIASMRLLASDRSAGKKMPFRGEEIEVKEATTQSLNHIDLALFSAGSEISLQLAPHAVNAGAVVIDNSAAFRIEPGVPLVVPEVNPEDLKGHKGLIANPNCATIQMVVAIYPLHKVNPIRRIIVDSYQSVSGWGGAAMEELSNQAKLVLEGKEVVPHIFPHQIAFNVLPEIDVFLDNGYSKEEWKMIHETRKIMHDEAIAISSTCVRVPVYIGHSEAIHLEFSRSMSPEEARHILSEAPGIKVLDDPSISLYPYPWSAAGSNEVFVGRIRRDASHPNGLVMWVVADNLRKGAALNAIQIAWELRRRSWI